MAEKNVVRKDVVEISWEIDNSGLKKLNNMMKDVKRSTSNMHQTTQKGWNNLVKGANKAKAALKPLDDKINQVGRSALNMGKRFTTGLGRMAVKGIYGATAAVAGLTGLSVKSYAEYEQLVGGVETLFKTSKGVVMDYAQNAYKTAGLSANQYMETVTSFSASLLQSLNGDTAKAANVADRAITDMADNANKMGTSMESIQYAYQGFAKQNYTMLDNLKLGYGGTQEEMKRLIKDASKMKDVQKELGITVDGNSMSFANIVNAISVMQSKMGIAGTTSNEAATTIQGSISAMKGAWQNFLTGLVDPSQNFDVLLKNLIDSGVTVAKNVLPRIGIVLKSVATELAPELGEGIKNLLLKAKEYLIANKSTIWEGFKTVMAEGIALIAKLFTGKELNIDDLKEKIQGIADKVVGIAKAFKDNWGLIKGVIIGVAVAIGVLKGAMLICNTIIAINNGIMMAKQSIDILAAAKTKVLAAAQWMVNTSFMGCPVIWLVAGLAALIAIVILVVKNFDKIKAAVLGAWSSFQSFLDKLGPFGAMVKSNINNAIEGAKMAFGGLKQMLGGIIKFITGVFTGNWSKAWDGIKDIFAGAWEALKGLAKAPLNAVISLVNSAIGALNKVKVKIPDWVPGYGGKSYGINIPKIPQLAEGGVLKRGQVGLLEGNGAEAVVPLEKNTGWIKAVASALGREGSRTGASSPRGTYAPSTSNSGSSRAYTEANTYAPVFQLNFTGTTDRTAERVIKQWIMESLEEVFDGIGRTNPRLTEV